MAFVLGLLIGAGAVGIWWRATARADGNGVLGELWMLAHRQQETLKLLRQHKEDVMNGLQALAAAVAAGIANTEHLLQAFGEVKAGQDAQKAQIAALQAQLETGAVDPAQLQALADTLNAESAKVDAVLNPPAASEPAPSDATT